MRAADWRMIQVKASFRQGLMVLPSCAFGGSRPRPVCGEEGNPKLPHS